MEKETNYLKISIVTPNYNGGEYLEETIKSILSQNYPNLEYIIIDGGSTDNSVEIIKKYEDKLAFWVSEKDNGLYDALQKGFLLTTGEIMGWLNSDDMIHSKSLFAINEILQLPNVKWLNGRPTVFDEQGKIVMVAEYKRLSKYDFWREKYKWIQQESTYWHRDLWNQSGGYIDNNLKLAGDFELWNRFFQYEKLFTVNSLIGGFRIRTKNQLSRDFIQGYIEETKIVLQNNKYSEQALKSMKKIDKLEKTITILKKYHLFNNQSLVENIHARIVEVLEYPDIVRYDYKSQSYFL